MKSLCFTGLVDDGYQEYLPLFVYSALSAYPDSELILFYVDPTLRPEVRECLDSLRDLGSFDVRPLRCRYRAQDWQGLKALRWVLYDDDFAAYENVYIGDVDMFIVRSEPSLRETRIRHSEEIGRPYSNRVRTGTTRVAGTSHFVRTQEYFPRVLPRMPHYREVIASGLRMRNEEMLYRLLAETVGLPERPVPLDTHPGIHLRAFHLPGGLAEQRARTDYLFTKVFERHFERFVELARSERCRNIVDRLSRIESSPYRLKHYGFAGPALAQQFGHAMLLCEELIEERERRGRNSA